MRAKAKRLLIPFILTIVLGLTTSLKPLSCDDTIPQSCTERKLNHKKNDCYCFTCEKDDEDDIGYCTTLTKIKALSSELKKTHYKLIGIKTEDNE